MANVEDLARAFANPEIVGIPEESIVRLVDLHSASVIASAVAEAARSAEDALIFYYSGHGLVGRQTRELYLATKET